MIMKRRRGSSNIFLILQEIRPLQLCSIKSLYRDVTSKYYHVLIFAKKFNQVGRKILQKDTKQLHGIKIQFLEKPQTFFSRKQLLVV